MLFSSQTEQPHFSFYSYKLVLKIADLQLEWEDVQRKAKWRWEREQGRRDAAEDMSEVLSEGEKGDTVGELMQSETACRKLQRNFSDVQAWTDDNNEKKFYIVLIRYIH